MTASEPLTLDEEYSMQQSWRSDHDKLTFIACLPITPSSPSMNNSTTTATTSTRKENREPDKTVFNNFSVTTSNEIQPGRYDEPSTMIGDVNLFLTPSDSDSETESLEDEQERNLSPRRCTGELELMIASPNYRRRGYGRATLLAFLRYISAHLDDILSEYNAGISGDREAERGMTLGKLRVKIGQENLGSLRLFEGLGFGRVGEVNYFGELELVLEGFEGEKKEGKDGKEEGRWAMKGYTELMYIEKEKSGS